MCKGVNNNGSLVEMDSNVSAKVMEANEKFAKLGRRVLAFAYYEVPHSEEANFFENYKDQAGNDRVRAKVDLNGKLILAGLFAIEDPPRPEVTPAVKACHSAGVRVIMVTGDFSLTAQAIAKEIGILNSDPEYENLNKVVSGDEISKKLAEVREDPNVKKEDIEGKVID